MEKKRILIIAIFVLVTAALGYILYRVFFAAREQRPVTPAPIGVTARPGAFPEAGAPTPGAVTPEGRPLPTAVTRPGQSFQPAPPPAREEKIVASPLVDPALDASGRVQYYNKNDGKFYRVGENGQPVELSDAVFYGVQNVNWSPTENVSIIEYPDGSNIYYNFQTKKQVTLPKHWENFSFSNTGDRVAAKSVGFAPENRWLVAADPDGGNIQFLEHMGSNDDKVTVDWSPGRQVVAFSQTGEPLGADRQEIILVGQNKENFRGLVVEGRGFQSEWSPTGKQLAYSVYSARNEFKPELWVTSASGDDIGANRHPLNIETWAEKCAFADERFLYCGVPTTLEIGSGFQPVIADNTDDVLLKIDLETGLRTPIPLDEPHTIGQIFVDALGKTITFTDKRQDGVFQVRL